MRTTRCGTLLSLALFLAGCPEDDEDGDQSETNEDSGSMVVVDSAIDAAQHDDEPDTAFDVDADVDIDADQEPDAGMSDPAADAASDASRDSDPVVSMDAGTGDSGVKLDGGTPDAGTADSGVKLDAGTADSGVKLDSGVPDSGVKLDSGVPDSGAPDSGVKLDAGVSDAAVDSGAPDAAVDSGAPDSGVKLDAGVSDAAVDSGAPTNTFTAAYAVISANCLGCHGSGNGSGNLQMGTKARAYDELVGGPMGNATGAAEGQCLASGKRRVIAFDAANSLIIQKLTGIASCGSSIMPPNSSGIGAGQIAVIQAWITAGAMND